MVKPDVVFVCVRDVFHRWKKAHADFDAIGTAGAEKSIVEALAVADAMTAKIESKERDDHDIDRRRIDKPIIGGFWNVPFAEPKIRFAIEQNRFKFRTPNTRNGDPYEREIPPQAIDDRPRIDLVVGVDG